MSDPENDSKPNKRGPKHMRLRYYTSYEEATIVKLWRQHLNAITSYTENLQIFREISFGLQQHRVRLNKQEVRRRISTYRNKYLMEENRLKNDAKYVSNWRLYPLIDCLFKPGTPNATLLIENNYIDEIESKIRDELPSLPHFSRHGCKSIKLELNPDSCPFLDTQHTNVQNNSVPNLLPEIHPVTIKTEIKNCDEDETTSIKPISPEKRPPLAPANRLLETPALAAFNFDSVSTSRRSRRRSIMPRTGQISIAQIERLRQENELLAEQRDAHLSELRLKEREYQQLEQTFDFWLHQQETWMAYLDKQDVK